MAEKQNNRPESDTQSRATVFADYARYYDLLYRDKDYAAEADYVAGLIKKYHPAAESILELGSGTGIHASLLAKKGFAVHGIERSQKMLSQAQTLAEKPATWQERASFSLGDIRKIRLDKRFDVVMALFHVISYQTTNKDVTETFQTARRHLKTGGIFLFDVWYGPAVLTDRPAVRIKRMADDQTEVTRLAEPVLYPNENRVDVHYQMLVKTLSSQVVSELKETHALRYFFKPEIERIAAQAEFHCLHEEEWLSGRGIGCDTWGVCFVLKAE